MSAPACKLPLNGSVSSYLQYIRQALQADKEALEIEDDPAKISILISHINSLKHLERTMEEAIR